jgi:hypothetical protein
MIARLHRRVLHTSEWPPRPLWRWECVLGCSRGYRYVRKVDDELGALRVLEQETAAVREWFRRYTDETSPIGAVHPAAVPAGPHADPSRLPYGIARAESGSRFPCRRWSPGFSTRWPRPGSPRIVASRRAAPRSRPCCKGSWSVDRAAGAGNPHGTFARGTEASS